MTSKGLFFFIGGFILLIGVGCRNNPQTPNSATTPTVVATETPAPTQDNLEETWVRTYGNGQESSGGDVIQTDDGGYLIVGGMGPLEDSRTIGGIMLLKTDASGMKIWQKTFGGKGYDDGWAITKAHSGGYILGGVTTSFGAGGMDGYLLKVDEEGNEVWSKTFGSELDETISMIHKTEDGGYFLIGNSVDPKDFVTDPGRAGYGGFEGRSNIFAVKTDGEGKKVWSHTFESEFNILTFAGVHSPAGGYYILSSIIYFPEKGDDLLLMMLDEDGQEVWSRTWENGTMGGNSMIQDSEGNLIITGRIDLEDGYGPDILIIKVDPQGNELWEQKFGEDGPYEIGRDLVETEKGDYVLLADKLTSFYSSDTSSMLISINKEGELVWTKELDIPYQLKSGSLLQDTNGGFLLTGATIGPNKEFMTILIKTDKDGDVKE